MDSGAHKRYSFSKGCQPVLNRLSLILNLSEILTTHLSVTSNSPVQLLSYWRLDSVVLTLKDHVHTANFSGYAQEFVTFPMASTKLLNEKRSFVEVSLSGFSD